MRPLLVLIKRQLVDNAIYFAAAIAASVILMVVAVVVAFTYNPQELEFKKLTYLMWIPVYVAVGFCVVGAMQSYTDRAKGISAMLLTLPVTRNQRLFAHVLIGTLLTVIVLLPVTITGIILCRLLLPPVPLFLGWLTDMFVGGFLTALACYCLGLHAGAKTKTFTLALGVVPLALVVLLLMVIKGLGGALIVILVPFIAASLLRFMPRFSDGPIANSATTFLVLVLLTVPLFCDRYLCDVSLVLKTGPHSENVEISPSGLLPPEIENNPNLMSRSVASCHMEGPLTRIFQRFDEIGWFVEHLGIVDYFCSAAHGGLPRFNFWLSDCLYFDRANGQLVYLDTERRFYAGPEGVSSTPGTNLGRLESPFWIRSGLIGSPLWCAAYDPRARCFILIDFGKQTAQRSPEVANRAYQPVDLDCSTIKSEILDVDWDPPYEKAPYGPKGYYRMPVVRYNSFESCWSVVDESGQVSLLNRETLELSAPVGQLPRPRTVFGWASRKPKDLLAYDVYLVSTNVKAEYSGMVAGSLSRDGRSMALAVFDKEGKEIKTAYSNATLFDVPGGPVLATMKYLFESLHPPLLTLASFFTAYSFEARSTHRALFLMPNSFVALARDRQGNIFWTLGLVLLLMLPALLFAGVLAWRVDRDAARLGLSHSARRLWLLGTVAFGLVGYITYRLSRPKATLVTCANCGHPRRPDMDKCHHCASPWHVPELTPPTWRVLDGVGAD